MKRHLMTLILSGFMGSMVLAGNAEACHKKKCTCAPTTCAVIAPAPCPPPAPVCAPRAKKCGGGLFAHCKGIKFGHKKCAPAPCGVTVVYSGPVTYSAPVTYSSPQSSAQH
jgi:hypothetical protein